MITAEFESYLLRRAAKQRDKPFGTYDTCPRCSHDFHGMACAKVLPVPGGSAPCTCQGGQQ